MPLEIALLLSLNNLAVIVLTIIPRTMQVATNQEFMKTAIRTIKPVMELFMNKTSPMPRKISSISLTMKFYF